MVKTQPTTKRRKDSINLQSNQEEQHPHAQKTTIRVLEAMDHPLNPFTSPPIPRTSQYAELYEARKKLPIFATMTEFYSVYYRHQIIILIGETGTGKTTQIPQFIAYADEPQKIGKIVACTQPRRISATSAAKHVADEMDVELGHQVGYSIRFDNTTRPGVTFLKYMTDGMLLREAMGDPDLRRYSTIILDEVHERTLAADVLMALLKALAKRRPDLKVIIMSATVDAVKLQEYFSEGSDMKAPLFNLPGRIHPIEIIYTQKPVPNYVEAAIRTVLRIHRLEDPGDILLFLTGEEEIEDACGKIELQADHLINQCPLSVGPLVCIPLYSALPTDQQQRIFDPAPPARSPDSPAGRKVIVATNIAETSLTIDGIVYVIDPGFSKQKVYHPDIRMESLLVRQISKASAKQRAGRAGRTKPGKCFRLYTQKVFMALEEQTQPRILRSKLSNTALTLVKLGVQDLGQFDWLDAPDPETLMQALELLGYLAALDDDCNLTPLGNLMTELPLDPQRLLLRLDSSSNVWMRPQGGWSLADDAKAAFSMPHSDHLTLLNVYNQYICNLHDKDWAATNYLHERALVEARNIRAQLRHMLERFHVELISMLDRVQLYENVRRALVSGFFMQVAHREVDYVTIKEGQRVVLHPSCGSRTTRPEWVIYNEFVWTTTPYIRTVSEVQPEWLLDLAPEYFDLTSFPKGAAKQALQKVLIKKARPRVEPVDPVTRCLEYLSRPPAQRNRLDLFLSILSD